LHNLKSNVDAKIDQSNYIYPTNHIGVARKFCCKICNTEPRKEDLDLTTFDLSVLVKATDNFSSSNRLGEGGFGPVYKVTKINKSITSTLVKYFLTIKLFSSSGYNGRWARDSSEKAFEGIGTRVAGIQK
jgi:hypothetical protein